MLRVLTENTMKLFGNMGHLERRAQRAPQAKLKPEISIHI